MPAFVRDALERQGLMGRYQERPWYQRNDYLGWIARAKRDETKDKRLAQMRDELEAGDVYMKMAWRSRL
ncbi:MAG: YdeI/OmpD-associated family protein [Pseudomonadota bacterium]